MLQHSKAFSGFSVNNLNEAKRFYKEKLGLNVIDNPMGLLELHLEGNNPIIIYPKPDHTPASFTILNFPVDDIDVAVDDLIEKGIQLERYTNIQTDEKGICRDEHGPLIAWFKDSAGNILSVLQER